VCCAALLLGTWAILPARAGQDSSSPAIVKESSPGNAYKDPLGKPRFLSLAEARAIALEQGSVGQPSRIFPGVQGLAQFQQLYTNKPSQVLTDPKADHGILLVRSPGMPLPEFERNLNQMLLNVETAYWNLYGSYWNLYSREQGLRFAYQAWRLTAAKFREGTVSIGDLAQVRGQYELFRAQRLSAIDTLLDNERQFRALTGMPIDDSTRLVPCDAPVLAPCNPDWKKALREALAHRPELHMARMDVAAHLFNLFSKTQRVLNGLFSDSQEDLSEQNVHMARLQLARSCAVLHDQEMKTERFLGLEYRRIFSSSEQIRAQRAQREALAQQLRAREEEFRAGRRTVDILLEAQRFWSDSLANEYNAIVAYNNALCAFAYAKGAITQYAHITITDHLPKGDHVRAVDRERERTKALHCEAALLADHRCCYQPGEEALVPAVPSLVALWKSMQPLKEALPLPESKDWQLPGHEGEYLVPCANK
jgi:hypothetical protein